MLTYRDILRGIVGRRTYMQYVYFHSAVTSLSMGMILYAKSSLELIVNNRIGKVGIRPLEPPPPPDSNRLASLICHRSQRTESLSVCTNVCPPACPSMDSSTRASTVSDIQVAAHIRFRICTCVLLRINA